MPETLEVIGTPETQVSGDRRVRLGYLINQYPAVSHTFIFREIEELRRRGLQIEITSINAPDRPLDQLPRREREHARETFYIKRAGAGGALRAVLLTLLSQPAASARGFHYAARLGGSKWLFYFLEALILGQELKQRGLGHLHVHFGTAASTVALIASRIFGFSLSLTIHGPDEFYDVGAYHLAEKIRRSRFICCIGNYARSQLMKLSQPGEWDKLHVSPLGVDPDLFPPRLTRPHGHTFEILCVGRLVPAKGQHILLSAVEQLIAQGRDVLLRFVGDGPDRASLAKRVETSGLGDRIVFEGAVDQEGLISFLERADAFALASFAEGIPVALMEAMAMEIPCVSTYVNGIPELIRDGIDGLLSAPSSVEELAQALDRLIADPDLRRRISMAGRERVQDKYNLAKNIGRLEEIFRCQLS
jgi:colanic acid/amylovoran biosynthesis glycosyltransferase